MFFVIYIYIYRFISLLVLEVYDRLSILQFLLMDYYRMCIMCDNYPGRSLHCQVENHVQRNYIYIF